MRTIAAAFERVGVDLHYAFRRLAASPGFTFAAILTLGLGIGANVAIFTLTYQVLLKPLPYRDPGQFVAVWSDASYRGVPKSQVSPPDFFDWQRQATTFSGLAAYVESFGTTATGTDGRAERVDVRMVNGDFFHVLGVPPLVGRVLHADDDVRGATGVAVVSYGSNRQRAALRRFSVCPEPRDKLGTHGIRFEARGRGARARRRRSIRHVWP